MDNKKINEAESKPETEIQPEISNDTNQDSNMDNQSSPDDLENLEETDKKEPKKKSKKKLFAGIGIVAIVIILALVFLLPGSNLTKKTLNRADFNQNVKTGLTTTSVILDVDENGIEEKDGKTYYKYTLTLEDNDSVSFDIKTDSEYKQAYIIGQENTYKISYEDCEDYTMTYYTTSIGDSMTEEELSDYDFDEELNNYYHKYFKEK